MSHAYGFVRFPSGEILFYEYNGTADIVIPKLYETCEEVQQHWREEGDAAWAPCSHGDDVLVEIATDYGGGFSWEARACRKCPTVTSSGLDEYGRAEKNRPLPEWAHQVWYAPQETSE
jgi:hypothetical protein